MAAIPSITFDGPKTNFHLPWGIINRSTFQIITSVIIPSDIKDSKEVILTEVPIPGLSFSPINSGGGGNRKISFTLPLIKRNNTVGNTLILQEFFNLRRKSFGLKDIFQESQQFSPIPKVLYSWGTGSPPLPCFVKKADFTHKQGWVNVLGNPQFSEVEIELWVDETDPIFKVEELFRKMGSFLGMAEQTFDTVAGIAGKGGTPF